MRKRIKTHIKKHKVVYSFASGGIVFAGITGIIMRGVASRHISGGISVAANRGISVVADRSVVTSNVSFISSRRKGSPSWVIRCLENGLIYSSQRKAALAMGLSESEISKQLNGLTENVRGYRFERICMAA